MAKREGPRGREPAALGFRPGPRIFQHIVVHPAGDVEPIPRRRPGQPQKGVGNAQHLPLHRGRAGDVVDEHVFVGEFGQGLGAVGAEVAVIAAGQDQKGAPVRRQGEGRGLAGGEVRQGRQIGIERLENRSLGRARGDRLAGGGEFAGRRSARIEPRLRGRTQRRQRQGEPGDQQSPRRAVQSPFQMQLPTIFLQSRSTRPMQHLGVDQRRSYRST